MRPDVIVADVVMPGVSGLELTRRLRADSRTSAAAIVILTGRASRTLPEDATDAGCDGFLLKPCLPESLARTLRQVLHERCAPVTGLPRR